MTYPVVQLRETDLMGTKPASISASELAELFDVSTRTITDLANRGLVKRTEHGRYELIASVRLYTEHLRDAAAGRQAETSGTLTGERARLAKEQADAQAMKNAVARGNLLPADEVQREWIDVLRTVRSTVLALPSRIRQALPHLTGDDVAVIDREVHSAMETLGDQPGNDPD